MKKTFTLVLITILVLTAVLAFAGCGTASDTEEPAASITIAVPIRPMRPERCCFCRIWA